MVDIATDHAKIAAETGLASIAIPLAIYMFSLWFIRDRIILKGLASFVPLLFAVLVLATLIIPVGMLGLTILMIACVIIRNAMARASGLADLGSAS